MGKLLLTEVKSGERLWEPLDAALEVGRLQPALMHKQGFFSFPRKSSNILAPESFTSLSSCQFISLAGEQVSRTNISKPRKAEWGPKAQQKGQEKAQPTKQINFFPSLRHEKVEFEIKQHHLYQGTSLQIFSALFLKA